MRTSRFHLGKRLLFTTSVCLLALNALSQDPQALKVSQFAPAKDLLQQVDFFIGRASDSLADPKDFDEAKQSRTFKDANTLSAIALALAMHDEEFEHKAAMPGLLKAAQQLATAGDNAELATQSLAAIKAARAGGKVEGASARWEPVASLAALMKQVPLIHSGLKRGVEPNRLTRQATQSAGQAAALAAVAQASWLDTEHIKKPEDVGAWREYCAQMRDAAGEVNSAVRAADQARVNSGMQRLAQSCETCHAKFRVH